MFETMAGHEPDRDTAPPADPPDSPAGASEAPVSLEVLEAEICQLAGNLAATTCQFLTALGDYDARRGWAEWDMPSCAAWLSWKCQMAAGTAREHVRVARALPRLPVIRGEFAAGQFSFSKVRALTRIATPGSDADLAEMAAPMTANQLDRFARAHRLITAAEDEAVRLARRLTWRHNDDGSLSISVRLPPEDGAAVLTALRAAVTGTPLDPDPDASPGSGASLDAETSATGLGGVPAETSHAIAPGVSAEARDASQPHSGTPCGDQPDPAEPATPTAGPGVPTAGPGALLDPARPRPTSTSLADALVEIAETYLAGKTRDAQNPDVYQVIIHATPDTLTPTPDQHPDPDRAPQHTDSPGASSDIPRTAPGTPEAAPDAPGNTTGHPDTTPDAPGTAPDAPITTPDALAAAAPSTRGTTPAAAPGRPGRRPATRCHIHDGPAISPTTLQMIACDAVLSWISHDTHGTTLNAGRRRRDPGPALRRALADRDHGRCQRPGCDRRASHAHHITWWMHGGITSLDNLISLCKRCHRQIHHGHLTLSTAEPGVFTFRLRDGTLLDTSPPLPAPGGQVNDLHDAEITPTTIVPGWYGERLDLDFALTILFANQETRQARQQEQAAQAGH